MIHNQINNILVVRLAGLGDMLLTLSAVSPIKDKYPDSKIYFLTEKNMIPFLKCFDFIEDAYEYKKNLIDTIKSVTFFRKINIDTIINFERSIKKSVLSYFIHSPIRIGYKTAFSNIFNTLSLEDFRKNPNIHIRERYFELVKPLNIDFFDTELNFNPPKSKIEKVEKFLFDNNIDMNNDIIVGINPVTGFKSKYWLNERWAKIADYLIEYKKAKVILTYGNDKDQLETCIDIMNKMKQRPTLSFKTDLLEFGALIKKLNLMICLDSGPFHFAVSIGIPTISLWGRGNIKQWGIISKKHILINKAISCSPCEKFDCDNLECMKSILVDDVVEAINKIFPSIYKLKHG